jgi:hypothetical protein
LPLLQGPETDPAAVDELRRGIAEERETVVELINYSKDGTPFWNQLMVSPVHDEDGNLLYFFSSQLDISRRREAQDLEQSEHLLLREVDHRAKNALALVQGIVRLSRSDDPQVYARSVQGRVDAWPARTPILAGWCAGVTTRWSARSSRGRALWDAARARGWPRDRSARRAWSSRSRCCCTRCSTMPLIMARSPRRRAPSRSAGGLQRRRSGDQLGRGRRGRRQRGERQPGFGVTMIDAIVRRQLRGSRDVRLGAGRAEFAGGVPGGAAVGKPR